MFERRTRERVIAIVAFTGDMRKLDVDRAAFELEQSGFRVTRLPDKFAARLAHPLDDFLEVVFELNGPADDTIINIVWDRINEIVDPYAGLAAECGVLEPDHVPFDFFTPDPVIDLRGPAR